MPRSIRFSNDTYLDSKSGIRIKRLYPTFDSEYVYTNQDFGYIAFQIGRLVFIFIQSIAFKKEIGNFVPFITGLPIPTDYNIEYLLGSNTMPSIRVSITNGVVQTHWTVVEYGDSANKQYSGLLVYETNE